MTKTILKSEQVNERFIIPRVIFSNGVKENIQTLKSYKISTILRHDVKDKISCLIIPTISIHVVKDKIS